MSDTVQDDTARTATQMPLTPRLLGFAAPVLLLLIVLYWRALQQMIEIWGLPDSYYSHGFLNAPVSLFLAWRNRKGGLVWTK